MILSLGVYGFMMGSLYLLATKAKYSKVRFLYYWISVLIFTVFCAIRYNVGVDYLSYLNEYNYVLLGSGFSRDFEPAFEAITKVLASSGCHFSIYFGIWSLLQIGILYYAMKNEKNIIPFLCFTLFCSGVFFMWMNGIRQSIAIMLFLLSINCASTNKLVKGIIVLLFASLFHKSSLAIIPILLIFNLFKNKKDDASILIQLIIIAIAFVVGLSPITSSISGVVEAFTSLLGYEGDYNDIIEAQLENSTSGWGPRRLIRLMICMVVVLYSNKMRCFYNSSFFNILYWVFYVGLILDLMFFKVHIITRFIAYFSNLNFILWAYLLFYLSKIKPYMSYVLTLLCLSVFLGDLLGNSHNPHNTILYKTFF